MHLAGILTGERAKIILALNYNFYFMESLFAFHLLQMYYKVRKEKSVYLQKYLSLQFKIKFVISINYPLYLYSAFSDL